MKSSDWATLFFAQNQPFRRVKPSIRFAIFVFKLPKIMKKQLLLLSSVLVLGCLSAQTTLTTADQPQVLDVYNQGRDTTMTQSAGNSGPSQAYVFSGLLNQVEDSMTFTLPQWTPYGTYYPATNLSIMVNQGDAYIYGDMTSTTFEIHGQAFDPLGSGVIPLMFSNPETQMIFPAAYGSSFADTAGGVNQMYYGMDPGIGFTVDSFRIHTHIYKDSEYDAWGTCETPLDTFNVLRQNTYRMQVDTIDIYAFGNWAPNFFSQMDSTRTFSYWTNGIGFPVVELTDQDDLGQISNCTWLVSLPTPTGIVVNQTTSISVYPNPATEVITFTTTIAEGSIELIDISGRVVRRTNITSTQTQMNVADLAAGTYSYRINGQEVAGKVQVVR